MKRLIVCSDGLWQNANSPAHSNVGLVKAAILPTATTPNSGKPVAQLSISDPFQAVAGKERQFLEASICWLYEQLALNYEPGDQLWFFGFSRGSFVVRSCIGLIRNAGLLKKQHLHRIDDAWHIYRTRWGADARNGVLFRNAHSHLPEVKFLGAWDSVGATGLPQGASPENNTLGFHDNVLSRAVENAYHALAIDETRKELPPCLWVTSQDRARTEQCWFTGNHRDIGGIGGNMALANISLEWMLERARAIGLGIDTDFLRDALRVRNGNQGTDFSTGVGIKTASRCRAIGVSNSDETLHSSAEQRFMRNPRYRPNNLKRFLQRDEQIQLPL
ncbi:MAG: DUF2235 domain-containing protein [Porticoccaceae bacterium]